MSLWPAGRANMIMRCAVVLALGLLLGSGCSPATEPGGPGGGNDNGAPNPSPPGNLNDNNNPGPATPAPAWREAFDASGTGVLSAVWGSGPSDVYAVGGTPGAGEVYHFDGQHWRTLRIPDVPLLVWVFGFGSDAVFAAGLGGGAIFYDGQQWTRLQTGTTQDIWGIWGAAPDDVWMVGGDVGRGEPLILHYNGSAFTQLPPPANDRAATALFKVWGIDGRVVAVGENGLIIEHEGGDWRQVATGPQADDDFIALWGTAPDNIVAVGGRVSGRVAVRNAAGWQTRKLDGLPALNAVFMIDPSHAVVGGINGFVGLLDMASGAMAVESAPSGLTVHAAWGDGAGRVYAVGGRFSEPFVGLALVRSADSGSAVAVPPLPPPPECSADVECGIGRVCSAGACQPAAGCAGGDDDADRWLNDCDNCPSVPNASQADADGDGAGDVCDRCPGSDDAADADGDGVPDGCDACPAGSDVNDSDDDGIPDGCDVCPGGADGADADADGVADACDQCPGFPDAADADHDGVPDGCDVCAGDDTADADEDGVPDACDRCPGGDDGVDADNDGVANFCDRCAGFPDSADADADGTPDGCDECPSTTDTDGDGVPDPCDRCPGFDDGDDDDADGTPDDCDLCPGGDDDQDADGDSTPDGCDVCPGGNDAADADADGVPDACDACAAGNDNADADGDGAPNACDLCPGFDDHADADGDGIPDGCDEWPACDNGVDADANGIPDGCCGVEGDCPLGQSCQSGVCEEAGADLEIGIGGGTLCVSGPYQVLAEDGELPFCEGFQGLSDAVLHLRATGFAPGPVKVKRSITHLLEPCASSEECDFACIEGFCSLVPEVEDERQLTREGGGVVRLIGLRIMLFHSVEELDGHPVVLRVSFTDPNNPALTASRTLPLELFAKRLCTGPDCPVGQTCVNNYCE